MSALVSSDSTVVYTVAFNRPDLIGLQYRSLSSFVREPLTYRVLNNAPNPEMDEEIRQACATFGVASISVPQRSQRNANVSHAWAVQWAWIHHLLPITEGVAVILDCDVFAVAPVSFVDLLGDRHLVGLEQRRGDVVYPWVGIIALNMERIPRRELINFMCSPNMRDEHVDVGGSLCEWIDNVAEYEDGAVDWRRLRTSAFDPPEGYEDEFGFELYEGSLVHYHAASNWDYQTHHDRKTACLRGWLERAGVTGSIDDPGRSGLAAGAEPS